MQRIVVIGGGFGGLSAAALLAKEGYNVILLEKNSQLGGRAMVHEAKGFRFDMGPSWYMMPDVFEKYFAEFGVNVDDVLDLQRLDPSYRIFFEEEKIDVSASLEKNIALFDSLENDGGQKFKAYLKDAEHYYNISKKHFLYRQFKSVFDFMNPSFLKFGASPALFRPLDKYVHTKFASDKARKILEYNIVFLGGNPTNTPAMFCLMAHVDFNQGVWYPQGGMSAVVNVLHELGKDLGVTYVTDSEATSIEVNEGSATHVIAGDKTYEADHVIVNADYHHAETKLLSSEWQTYPEEYWQKKTIAPSAFIIYLGLNTKIPKLTHHNLVLRQDWMKHFANIFDDPKWPEEFSYYISCPSKTDPSVAPRHCENLFVLVPVACGLEDTPEIRAAFYEVVITDMEKTLGIPLRDHIVYKKTFAHKDFSSLYNSYKGTALGLTHTLMQTAAFRPANTSKKVSNLYYTGQWTQPGIGVPMTLISSTIVRNLINNGRKKAI